MSSRGLHVTLSAPGAAAALQVQLAPPAAVPRSTHAMVAEDVEGGMVDVMQDLRIATVDHNAEVAESYEHVRQRVLLCRER